MRPTESTHPPVRAELESRGARVALLVSRYNEEICGALLESARRGLEAHGVASDDIEVHRVPGAFELITAASWAARSGRFHAVIGLGCVIKGETDHDVYLNHAVAGGFSRIGQDTGVPVVFGVLTTLDREQAEVRADPGRGGGKGWECALAALEMIQLRTRLAGDATSPAGPGAATGGPGTTERSEVRQRDRTQGMEG